MNALHEIRYCQKCGATNIGKFDHCLLCQSPLLRENDPGEDASIAKSDERFEAQTIPTSQLAPAAYLVFSSGPSEGQRIQLRNGASLGRSIQNDVLIDSPDASRKHAEVALTRDGFWLLTDLNSTNGTFVDQEHISKPVRLQAGNRIQIGEIELLVEMI